MKENDRHIWQSMDKLVDMTRKVKDIKDGQRRLNTNLDYIHSEQVALEQALDELYKEFDSKYKDQIEQTNMRWGSNNDSMIREETYALAEGLNEQLNRMQSEMTMMTEDISSRSTNADMTNPMSQLMEILNVQLTQLAWIDQQSSELTARVNVVAQELDTTLVR